MLGEYLTVLVELALMSNALGQAVKPAHNKDYLGSKPSKAYYFPWVVTIHLHPSAITQGIRQSSAFNEIVGSGSILTGQWVLASMDSLIRRSKAPPARPFYQNLDDLIVFSSGVWGTPYLREGQTGPNWLQERRVAELFIWSDPDRTKAVKMLFTKKQEPPGLNRLKRGPFGFSMSIALIKIRRTRIEVDNPSIDQWIFRRITLPMPLFADSSKKLEGRLREEIGLLERDPHRMICHVGGWRLEDFRLVEYEVVYVPLKECQSVYCGFDHRACHRWPVEGVHACFRSVSFTDVCWPDQGSALYCQEASDSVIAILTSAPTCGVYGLPGVFTLIHHGMALFESVVGPNAYKSMPKGEMYKYTPPPAKFMFPVYR